MNTYSRTRTSTSVNRPKFRTERQQFLFRAWMESYRKNPVHCLRDANKNLHGFTREFQAAMENLTVDYAFRRAISRVLRHA